MNGEEARVDERGCAVEMDEATHRLRPICPACGGSLIEIRGKSQCERCHTICETCCEGARW
ncbi:MAG: hypothetical protein SFU86_07285 [Pirellulaceae bacterium]|nr:hypothetical protein [Pirellulaceae bacterium]